MGHPIPPILTDDLHVVAVVRKSHMLDAVTMTDRDGGERILMSGTVEHMQLIGSEIWITLYAPNGGWPVVKIDAKTGVLIDPSPQPQDPLVREPLLGESASRCPTCGVELARRPRRKTKCPACKTTVCVRTRPQDRASVLTTEADAAAIDDQWLVVQGLSPRPEHNVRQKAEIHRELREAAADADWGLYYGGLVRLGQIHEREGDHAAAVKLYGGALYLGAAGATNPGFDPAFQSVAPGLAASLSIVADAAGWSLPEIEARYLEAAGQQQRISGCPVSPADSWALIRLALPLGDGSM